MQILFAMQLNPFWGHLVPNQSFIYPPRSNVKRYDQSYRIWKLIAEFNHINT